MAPVRDHGNPARPPPTATAAPPYLTLEWPRRWPGEEVWRARRR